MSLPQLDARSSDLSLPTTSSAHAKRLLAVAMFGWAPSVAIPVAWGAMAAMWFATMFGEVFGLPTRLLDALPFSAVPYMPFEPMSWMPEVVMTAVAALLIWSGIYRFARRDIRPG